MLMYAGLVADAATMRVLLDAGANPNATNPAGATPLIYSASDPDKAKLLVSRGANVNVQSEPGATPILVASSAEGNAAAVRLLIAKGAKVNVRDKIQGIPGLLSGGGSTPPVVAASRLRNPETLRVLLAAGADVNAQDANGATALSDAVLFENAENVRILLTAGAKVNFQIGAWKQTPLIAAAMRPNPKVLQMLLDAHAEVNARDGSDSKALMWAANSEYGDPAAVRALLAAGADVNHANQWGETAMTWARRRGETAIVAAHRDAGARDKTPVVESAHAAAAGRTELVGAKELPSIRTAVEKGLPGLPRRGRI